MKLSFQPNLRPWYKHCLSSIRNLLVDVNVYRMTTLQDIAWQTCPRCKTLLLKHWEFANTELNASPFSHTWNNFCKTLEICLWNKMFYRLATSQIMLIKKMEICLSMFYRFATQQNIASQTFCFWQAENVVKCIKCFKQWIKHCLTNKFQKLNPANSACQSMPMPCEVAKQSNVNGQTLVWKQAPNVLQTMNGYLPRAEDKFLQNR